MNKKIRVAFIYKDCPSLSESNYYTQHRNLLLKAFRRNTTIEMNYVLTEKTFEINKIKDNTDIILLYEDQNISANCVPDELQGIEDSQIPVIVKIGDPWAAKKYDVKEQQEKYKIGGYFGTYDADFFYKYYPKTFKYKRIFYGIEPSLYQNVLEYDQRIKNKILNSGAVANKKLHNRVFAKLFKGEEDPMRHYKLRTMCNGLPYVTYTTTLGHEYVGDKYSLLLQKYSAAIAATTDIYTMKYFEMPASGCLTFMEVNNDNFAKNLGYRDNESAIFINEKNYKQKFDEYISDLNNPKWRQIANAGREHSMKTFNNDEGVNSLVEFFKEFM